jgi:acyl-CoA thioester hydrolase
MSEFRFYHPIEVRYGDLDPQGHVNNAKFLTFFEQARVQYFLEMGLFHEGDSFMDIGVILADVHLTFQAPILWGTPIKTGARVSRLGNKSLTIEQTVVHAESGQQFANGTVVMVTYDYHSDRSIPIPDDWREKISAYEEGLSSS